MAKTTEVINLTITKIVEGDTSEPISNRDFARFFAELMKNLLGVDDVTVEYAKAFVTEE